MTRTIFLSLLILVLPMSARADIIPFSLKDLQLADKIDKIGPYLAEEELHARVKFWISIYTRIHRWQYLVHDAKYPEIIYGVLDVKGIKEHPTMSNRGKRRALSRAKRKYRKKIESLLRSIHKKLYVDFLSPDDLSLSEKRIHKQFFGIKGNSRFLEATEKGRIRSQPGLRQNFVESIYESGRYLPGMKQIAVRSGVPPEIVYLPFVESGFDRNALSKVGASGVWQFIPSTGKFYLRVDEIVDERNDPMKAAEGAALLMKQNFMTLGAWPLAVTAYNYGRKGMKDAKKALKTSSLAKIIDKWNGYTFGFASKNFYCSFFAALHVAKNSKFYFGDVERAEPMLYDNFVMPEFVEFEVLAKHVGINEHVLQDYNPALTKLVIEGKKLIPVGYNLRVPLTKREVFLRRYKTIPSRFKFRKQRVDPPASEK